MGDHAKRGATLFEQKRYELAIEQFLKELARNPDCTYSTQMLARCFLAKGDAKEGLNWAKKAVELDPEDAHAFNLLGEARINTYVGDGPAMLAVRAFQTSIKLAPSLLDNYWMLGWIYLRQAQWLTALKWLERGLAIDPLNATCLCFAGWCHAHLGRLSKGEQMLRQSLAQAPLYERPYYYLARIAILRGDFETAKNLIEEASRINPHRLENQDFACEVLKAKSKMYRFLLVQYQRLEFLYDFNRIFGQMVGITIIVLIPFSYAVCPPVAFAGLFILIFAVPAVLYVWATRTGSMWLHPSKRHYLPEHQKTRLKYLGIVGAVLLFFASLGFLEDSSKYILTTKLDEARRLEEAGNFVEASKKLVAAAADTSWTSAPTIRNALSISSLNTASFAMSSHRRSREALVKASFGELFQRFKDVPPDKRQIQEQLVMANYAEAMRIVGLSESETVQRDVAGTH